MGGKTVKYIRILIFRYVFVCAVPESFRKFAPVRKTEPGNRVRNVDVTGAGGIPEDTGTATTT